MMANTESIIGSVESGVIGKLLKLLKDTDLSKYEYVYICARTNGRKIKGAWFCTARDVVFNVEKFFNKYRSKVETYEVEFLYDAETRVFNISNEHLWNSLRGLRSIVVDAEIQIRRSALQMLSENKSFHQVVNAALTKSNVKEKSGFPVSLFKTKQYLISDSAAAPIELFRGNTVVSTGEINVSSLKKTISLMTAWLANQVNENGYANYKYWPSRGHYSSANNPIRQWMATVCLNRCATAYKNPQLQNIANKNLSYNLETTFKESNGLGYIWMNGTAKLGALSLAALAIFESPLRKKYLNHEYKLCNTIYALSNSNGSFDTFLIPRWRKDNQNFYSGEALLFLATRYSISRNPEELSRIMDAFSYYRDWHRNNRNPAFVPWHTQAYFLIWQTTKNEALKDFIFEMNDWLLSMQQWESAEFPDMQGRFYDPKRSHFGPPHASSTGVYLEGLIDAFSLAKQVGDDDRAENYRIAIVRGIRSIMQLQFKDEVDYFYISDVNCVLGGLRTTVYDNTIRIDNVQHGLMALLKIINRFCESDYVIDRKGNDDSFKQYIDVKYKHFKKIDFSIDIEAIRKEINSNEHLWLENTSRQQNIKVQRETQTIFLRTAKKPFPPGVSGNDVHLSVESKNSVSFPLLMETLQKFATSVDGELSRVTVVRLQPESRVYPHIDEGEYYKFRDRYHIVVYSPSGSEMIAGDEKLTWREGEFWWFDNKAMHEAHNKGEDFRVHIIFDVLPNYNRKYISDTVIKQKIYSSPLPVVKSLKSSSVYPCFAACELELNAPVMSMQQVKKYKNSNFLRNNFSLPEITVEHYENVILVGNKFVIIDDSFHVLEASLPTFHHKPDPEWFKRKPEYHAEVYGNEVLVIDEPCAIISNSNWKNYWHWHAQCITSIQAIKKAGLFGKVKLVTPPLNEWRLKSLLALGVEESMLIKVRANLIRVKSIYRPSFVNKDNQPSLHPSSIETYRTIRDFYSNKKGFNTERRKIYVARFDAKNARHLVNEEMLAERLRIQGFDIITPGQLSYEEQVEVFSQADVVVGAHGAGLTNIVFCEPGALVVEIFPEYYFFDKKQAYRNHAHIGCLNYACYVSNQYISEIHQKEAKSLLEQGMQSNFPWLINVDEFFGFLNSFI